jgi:hypothetical protein
MAAPAVTPTHHYQLKRFVRLVDEMSRSRFIQAYRSQDQTIAAGISKDGEDLSQNPEYDLEDLKSFLTCYRQVGYATSDKPSVNLKDIVNIVDLYAGPTLKANLVGLRSSTIFPRLEGRYECFRFTKFKENFEPEKSVTSGETLKALLNGLFFHPDKKHSATIEFLESEGAELWMYLWPVMNEIIVPVLQTCVLLFKALRSDGILHDDDYPAHCLPTRADVTPAASGAAPDCPVAKQCQV